jgi:hypothetical protein
MNELKDRLVNLVVNEDISSIELMCRELELDDDKTRSMLEELCQEGRINGYITEDGRRFFRRDIEVSPLPTIHQEGSMTNLGTYDSRPGKVTAIIGLILVIIGYSMLWIMGSVLSLENVASAILLVGLAFLLGGCYWIGSHKTPI